VLQYLSLPVRHAKGYANFSGLTLAVQQLERWHLLPRNGQVHEWRTRSGSSACCFRTLGSGVPRGGACSVVVYREEAPAREETPAREAAPAGPNGVACCLGILMSISGVPGCGTCCLGTLEYASGVPRGGALVVMTARREGGLPGVNVAPRRLRLVAVCSEISALSLL